MVFRFMLPTKLLFGAGSLNQLGKEASKLGKKAMIVTGSSSMRKTGVLDRVTEDLKSNGMEVVVFDKIEPNPRDYTIDEGAKIVREEKVDLIIGLGGGSSMDASKAIALASSGTEPIWAYYEGKADAKGGVPSIVLVPTVAATGSEANPFAVVTHWDTGDKKGMGSRFMTAKVSIIDPELTFTLPARQTAQGGVDIICHVVEEYLTTAKPSPVTDGIAETVIKTSIEYLPKALAKLDDLEARTNLLWASTVACSQFHELGQGIENGYRTLHDIEHALSGFYDIAHGDGLAALLPAWMRFTLPAREERFKLLAKNVFGTDDAIKSMEEWLDKVNMHLRLRDIGIGEDKFEAMADSAIRMGFGIDKHPRTLDAAAIAQIYRDSY